MRPLRWLSVTLALCLALPAAAQRISQVAPGTLVRITTRAEARTIGPLAEVRGDSVYLASTPSSPHAVVPLADIVAFEVADGTASGHGALGAMIGGGIGVGLGALASGRGKGDDGSMFLGGGFFPTTLILVGTLVGYSMGSADAPVHWVLPEQSTSSRNTPSRDLLVSPQPARVLSFRVRF